MHRLFCRIAGVDPVALEDCPNTDRIWATQLGFSLVLNFFLLFGLTFYSVGYFLPELYARLRDKPHRTGKPGCEPGGVCHELVQTVKEIRETNSGLRKDVEALQARAQELDDRASDFLKRRNAAGDGLIISKRKEITTLRAEVGAFDSRAIGLLSNYAAELQRDGTYRPLRDDPMIRIRVLDELRQDPVRGPAITTMSHLIRAFIAFLELAPVLAKLFFAPPTVYSARIRTAVALGQNRALRERDDQLSLSANSGIHVYSFDSMNSGHNDRLAAGPAQKLAGPPSKQLGNSQSRMLPMPERPPMPERAPDRKPIANFSLDDLNQFGISKLRAWIESSSENKRAAGDYYVARLAQDQFLLDSDRAIAKYCQSHFDREARFFELGFGFGELSLCLTLGGFHTTGFESDGGRYAGASALVASLGQQGVDTSRLSLVFGAYPDVLRLDGLDLGGESVFVSTNVTSSLLMETIDRVMRSLRHFDHLIIDLSRFGEVRDLPSQQTLISQLQKLGFSEVAQVYSVGDTDIRHFRH